MVKTLLKDVYKRQPYGATGYPVYTSGELKLESVLAALSTDETYSEDIRKDFESLGNTLGLDIKHAFNPSIVNTACLLYTSRCV